MSEKDKARELDDFWSLDKLVPKKKTVTPFATRPAVHDFNAEDKSDAQSYPAGERKLTATNPGSLCEEYKPDHPLIQSVKIIRRIDKYDFYGSFRKSAMLYFGYKTEKCEFSKFYSYMPQYSQLTEAQKNYYFYWRSELYRGNYIKTDYSYLYLFVYEILNLPDLIPPKEGLELLINLWRAYRVSLPRIDAYFSVWVEDYCLVHKLAMPSGAVSDFIYDILGTSSFGEFYLNDIDAAGDKGIDTMLAITSSYDYRRSKYALGNPDVDAERQKRQSELYSTHIRGSMRLLLSSLAKQQLFHSAPEVLRRDAFPGSLCTHTVKCTLEVEYYPINRNSAIAEGITAAVKYAENRMRKIMGVKSRLAVRRLPLEYEEMLAGYFNALEKRELAIRKEENKPAYLEYYSAPREAMSLDTADKIESLSWITTKRLVDGVEEYTERESESVAVQHTAPKPIAETGVEADIKEKCVALGLAEAEIAFLSDIAGGIAVPYSFAGQVLADAVNAYFTDTLGDVVLESDGLQFSLIEDYREDVAAWLTRIHR